MARLPAISPETASGETARFLAAVKTRFGFIPNMIRGLANSPAALKSYMQFAKALGEAALDARTREAIALVTSAENGCDYGCSAHIAAAKMLGIDDEEAVRNLSARSSSRRRQIALELARSIVGTRGGVPDEALTRARHVGYSDGEIAEIVATVAFTTFANFFNRLAQTEIDFPLVTTLSPTRPLMEI